MGIGFILTPLIARIYGPNVYGQFAIFTAIISLIQPYSTFQLPTGYVAAKDNQQFYILVKISFLVLISISLLTLLGSLFFINLEISKDFPKVLILYLGVYVFFSGVFNIFRGWNIKLEEFKRSAQAKVVATAVGKTATIGYGSLIGQNVLGLVFGSILAFITESTTLLSTNLRSSIIKMTQVPFSLKLAKETIKDFAEYPKYVSTNSLLNSISTQAPIYFISAWYTTSQVGLFSLSMSLILIPINLVAVSIGAVYLPKISAIINDKPLRNEKILSLYKSLFYPALFALITFALVLKLLLPLLLGVKWTGASQLSAIMASSFALSVVSVPLANTFRLIRYENANLRITVIFLLLKIMAMLIAASLGDFLDTVFAFLLLNLIHQSVQLIVLFKKLELRYSLVIRDTIVLTVVYISLYQIFQSIA